MNTQILQGSAATELRWGGTFYRSSALNATVKEYRSVYAKVIVKINVRDTFLCPTVITLYTVSGKKSTVVRSKPQTLFFGHSVVIAIRYSLKWLCVTDVPKAVFACFRSIRPVWSLHFHHFRCWRMCDEEPRWLQLTGHLSQRTWQLLLYLSDRLHRWRIYLHR